jgi:hypothetical protein
MTADLFRWWFSVFTWISSFLRCPDVDVIDDRQPTELAAIHSFLRNQLYSYRGMESIAVTHWRRCVVCVFSADRVCSSCHHRCLKSIIVISFGWAGIDALAKSKWCRVTLLIQHSWRMCARWVCLSRQAVSDSRVQVGHRETQVMTHEVHYSTQRMQNVGSSPPDQCDKLM